MGPPIPTTMLPSARARLRLGSRATLVIAAVLFVGVFFLRLLDTSNADGETLLYMIPVGVLALGFGLRGGLAGAVLGFALTVWWDLGSGHVTLTALGYVNRALAYALIGVLAGAFVDDRRRLEAELLRYFEESLDLLWTADLSGRLLRVNHAWGQALGISTQAMRERPLIEFIHPRDRDAASAEILALARGQRQRIATRSRFRTAEGSYVWMEWRARTSASTSLIEGVAHDVTTQLKAERHLADEAKRLASRVSERTRDLNEARAETLQLLAVAGEYRDDETSQHTERVGILAARIGSRLGLSEQSVTLLREAAPLHDIGKLAIPDRVLLKPGRLSGTEQSVMHAHATLGARLLYGSHSPALQLAGVIAESHHEWWDGSGYPKGLTGVNIPLVGRIVAVADVFDALTHDRPYKPAWPLEQTLAMIRSRTGSQFDPCVVEAFLEVLDEIGAADATMPSDPSPPPPSVRVRHAPVGATQGATVHSMQGRAHRSRRELPAANSLGTPA
jgi:PAS domain S-box-containing protein